MKIFVLLKKSIITVQREGVTSLFKKAKIAVLRTYKQFTFKPYVITKTLEGETLELLIGDVVGEEWYVNYTGLREFQWIKENLRKGDTVADCGAHHGVTGILFARWVGPTGKVIGFEGSPHNVQIARKNIELNQVTNFDMRNEVAGRQKGTIRFADELCGAVAGADTTKTVEVPMVSLDGVFQLGKPTFLKIDVEGYEIEVLYGARDVMAACPKFDLEIHCVRFKDRSGALKEILALLQLHRYQTFIQLFPNAKIAPYNPNHHTPEVIAAYDNPHLFGLPKK